MNGRDTDLLRSQRTALEAARRELARLQVVNAEQAGALRMWIEAYRESIKFRRRRGRAPTLIEADTVTRLLLEPREVGK